MGARARRSFGATVLVLALASCGGDDADSPASGADPDVDALSDVLPEDSSGSDGDPADGVGADADEADAPGDVADAETSSDTGDANTVLDSDVDELPDEDSDGSPGPDEDRATLSDWPRALPFELRRDPIGVPVPSEEVAAVTRRYLQLLDTIGYFDFVAQRAHGWPQDGPGDRYWYSTWWSGVRVERAGDRVTFVHSEDGADNNGLRSAQLMEGACFATALWGAPDTERLTRAFVRGFVSWALAWERESAPGAGVYLARAAYPESFTVPRGAGGSISWTVDYDASRPGVDADPSHYVHVADNPYWGDLWVKNIRSKDDIGHMFRGLASLVACYDAMSVDGRSDIDQLTGLYFAWARRVEDDGNRIVTLDADLNEYFPSGDLATYIDLPGVECPGKLLMRLAGRAYTGGMNCGNGVGPADRQLSQAKNGTAQILRSHHLAAAMHALIAGRDDVAEPLLRGVTASIDWFAEGFTAGERPFDLDDRDFAAHLLHSAVAGVPLTAREVGWLHQRIDAADAGLRALPAYTWDLFGPDVPDGQLPFEPASPGLWINDLALPLGFCASPWVNPGGQPLLDCELVRSWRD